ncbi:MAG: type II toxin-antitoxin system VapC family toxin, partial [Terriglobia bacterium]
MSRFVLDNTVTMAWCFADEATEYTETLLSRLSDLADSALVPALWLYEVVNVVELATRKGRILEAKARGFLESLGDLPIEIENPARALMFDSVRALA